MFSKCIGRVLKHLRGDLTMRAMSERLHCTHVHINDLEKGKGMPSAEFIDRLIEVVGKEAFLEALIKEM